MENGMDWLFWAILIIGALAFLYVPQFLAKRRQKKREEELAVGDQVMTIGGLIGRLTYIDFDENVARIKLGEGVEIRIVPGAISGKHQDAGALGEIVEDTQEADASEGSFQEGSASVDNDSAT